VDADGLLNVSAREQTTGVESRVVVKPSYGLSDEEVERMLRESFSHAKEDEAARALREAQVDADRLLEAVSAALTVDGDALLSAAERTDIASAMQVLRSARAGTAGSEIKRAMESLDSATREFAARRMDAGIRKALAGHRLEEFNALPPGESK